MSLKDHLIKSEYRSLIDDMVRDFIYRVWRMQYLIGVL